MNSLFRSVTWTFLALFLQAALCFGGDPAGKLSPQEQGKIFFDGIAKSEDVPWLERLAGSSMADAEKAIPQNVLSVDVLDVRIAAYARLGELHTKESLAAVERIENKAKERGLVPEVVSLDYWRIPVFHSKAPEIKPLATIKSPDGTTYGVITNPFLMGGNDFFLISTKTPDDKSSWSRPKLILADNAPVGISEASLAFKSNGVLELTFAAPKYRLQEGETTQPPVKRKLEIPIRQVLGDQDADGWTDIEELRLGLNPLKKDTDGDGIDDGKDPCANFAPPAGEKNDEESQILQKALFAEFGLTQCRFLLLVEPNSTKAQAWGYAGPIIYLEDRGQWRAQHKNGGIFVNWTVAHFGDEAQVSTSYRTPTVSSKQEINLRKIDGKWIVCKRIEKDGLFISVIPED